MVKIDNYEGRGTEKIKSDSAKPKTHGNTAKLDSELYEGRKRMQNHSDRVNRDAKRDIDSMFGDTKTPTQKKAVHKNGIEIEKGGGTMPAVKRWMRGDKSF
jgi:hypothetical protein